MKRALEARARWERDETGAVAVLVVLLSIVVFACLSGLSAFATAILPLVAA